MNHYNYKGEPHTVKQLSELSGIPAATIRDRIRRGYSVEQAVRLSPANDSVQEFCEASLWEDWLNQSIGEVHTIYYKWCLSHDYSPLSVQGFSRHLMCINPWLKTVPTRRGNKCHRIIRVKDTTYNF